ncbi:MAG: DUF1573 domain-containing protein [Patescibacteria group bacterium]|nr:DUF1573 domain-containing protein [Patescibacteria group bacterium]
MKPKTIFIILAVCLVLAGLLTWSYIKSGASAESVQGVSQTGAKSALTATTTFYDLGNMPINGGEVTKEFTVANPTDKDIFVSTLITSCMCTNAYIIEPDGSTKGPFGMLGMGYVPPADETIKAGESRIIRVVFNPAAHGPAGLGMIDRFITLTDSAGGTLVLEIKGVVTP